MTLSVLMSVYASEKPENLSEALRSVTDLQTHKPDEVVLICDGPLTPELEAVIARYASREDISFVILRNEKNLGLTKSLNRGLAHAHGKYLARMDSDDISLPHRFEHQLAFMETHPDISALGGSLQEFNEENPCLMIRTFPTTPQETAAYICKASPLAHPSVMLRREIFDHGFRYDERYRTSQDIALWFDIICSGGKIANLQEPVLKFRRDGEVFMRRGRAKAKNELKIYLSGIRRLHGLFTLKYAYPLLRFTFRMLPLGLVKALYNSKLRTSILNNGK